MSVCPRGVAGRASAAASLWGQAIQAPDQVGTFGGAESAGDAAFVTAHNTFGPAKQRRTFVC